MQFYKVGDHMWEVGTPVMVILFIEDVEQAFLDDVKHALVELGIEHDTIQTILFTKLKFGAVLIEEGKYFKPSYWDEPPQEVTNIEDNAMGVLFDKLKSKRWDGLWYKHTIADDMMLEEIEFDGLANHVLGFTANDVGFGFVSTKENVEEPIMFFRTILDTNDEPESEPVLNEAVEEPPEKSD